MSGLMGALNTKGRVMFVPDFSPLSLKTLINGLEAYNDNISTSKPGFLTKWIQQGSTFIFKSKMHFLFRHN